ncbi:hypothetical protein EXIGLDRAFT_737164 [Exidia glandulosa HHB12029]|uniref:Uncharacterized protein n=1 Tax=Exidia glandulosa HHB12029 TaxID=1314781 RepID=A0A165J3B6_EXIGL|nr:hypothetical protein EXIGLDRAFT_737164 [Exidia glandulosa HHB12029]
MYLYYCTSEIGVEETAYEERMSETAEARESASLYEAMESSNVIKMAEVEER